MSSGHTGAGTPDEGDDPFAYLYRPADGSAPQRQTPRQPSYNQVRPVGERTFGGQQGGYGYPPQQQRPQTPPNGAGPDARYAAPETQAMPGGPRHTPPPAGRRGAPPPRRNGLLIGAIAVACAVLLGVIGAIAFSGGGDEDDRAGDDPTTAPSDTGGDGQGGDDEPSDEPTEDEDEAGELPTAGRENLQVSGAGWEDSVENASSDDGSYIALHNAKNSTITWSFELDGEPLDQYWFYVSYSAVSDGQSLSFSVNGEQRDDAVDLKDWATGSDEWADSWVKTFNYVNLQEGENTIQMTCSDSCDVLIDRVWLSDHEE
ncbi:hypothetical protein [Streptomyces sp. RFCAC02]|uniref:hypothetical protein n=1 Tax=Streptomyces sp. RFCAC02 TaxID=2499143 RepID=UPI00143D2392|nr:hypothetical protein [Streptomyces sp. RFCAC02]